VLSAGKKLRELREHVGLTLRDVEIASTKLAESRGIEEFVVNPSRLSDIETKGVIPSIFRLYVLSVLYRADFTELLKIYGVDLSFTAEDFSICSPSKTHRLDLVTERGSVSVPVKLDRKLGRGADAVPARAFEKEIHVRLHRHGGFDDVSVAPAGLLPASG
jgi:transcriptional regulator with XRE-family HTH domain